MFLDRADAGKKLARLLIKKFNNIKDGVVIAIPTGGVIIGYYIAKMLNLSLDVIIVRKIGAPHNKEFALASVTQDGSIILNHKIKTSSYKDYIEKEAEAQLKIIKDMIHEIKGDNNLPDLRNKQVILTDDGIATGTTVLSLIKFIKKHHPKKIILAIPVGPKDVIIRLMRLVDDCVCLEVADNFFSVSQFYKNFRQIKNEEIKEVLESVKSN